MINKIIKYCTCSYITLLNSIEIYQADSFSDCITADDELRSDIPCGRMTPQDVMSLASFPSLRSTQC